MYVSIIFHPLMFNFKIKDDINQTCKYKIIKRT